MESVHRLVALPAIGSATLLVMALLTGSCGNPCVDLQDVCDLCNDTNQKASCEHFVDQDVSDLCEENIDNFNQICE